MLCGEPGCVWPSLLTLLCAPRTPVGCSHPPILHPTMLLVHSPSIVASHNNRVILLSISSHAAVGVRSPSSVHLTLPFLPLTPPLWAGTGEAWSVDYLAEVIKFDHGYTTQVGEGGAGPCAAAPQVAAAGGRRCWEGPTCCTTVATAAGASPAGPSHCFPPWKPLCVRFPLGSTFFPH